MPRTLLMILAALVAIAVDGSAQQPARNGEAFVGAWQGTLEVQGIRLRLGLRIERDQSGELRGTLTSIDQGNQQIPAAITLRGDTVVAAMPPIQATYAATLAGDSLRGTFTQGPASFPLRMGRVAAVATAPPLPHPTRLAPDAEVRALLARRVDEQKRAVGIVVGMIDPDGRRVVAYGRPAAGAGAPVDGNTLFEIGSVTKVFTSLLLAEMAQRGEVALDTPAAALLPPGVTMPQRGARPITLTDLATHTSGLPRLPANLAPGRADNPYADYSVDQLHAFLSGHTLARAPGERFEYSNLGAGLLGHLLALRAGSDYETLVRSRILDPLGMRSTTIALSPELRSRMAVGHDTALRPVSDWDLPTLAGAGALRSTANDMLSFLAANLGSESSPLAPAMADMLATRRPAGSDGAESALGWQVLAQGGHEMVTHSGGTGGFRTFVGFDRARRVGVVVLSNASAPEGVDDIGAFLLRGGGPLYEGKARTAVPVDTAVFDRLVGRYQLVPGFVITITREGDRFFLQATAQPKLEMYAEGPRDYFLGTVDAQVTFQLDPSGRATALVLHQNGADQLARRID